MTDTDNIQLILNKREAEALAGAAVLGTLVLERPLIYALLMATDGVLFYQTVGIMLGGASMKEINAIFDLDEVLLVEELAKVSAFAKGTAMRLLKAVKLEGHEGHQAQPSPFRTR